MIKEFSRDVKCEKLHFFRQIALFVMILPSDQRIFTRKIVKLEKLHFFRQIAMFVMILPSDQRIFTRKGWGKIHSCIPER